MRITNDNKELVGARLGMKAEEFDRASECYLGFYLVARTANQGYEIMNKISYEAYILETFGPEEAALEFEKYVRIPFSVETVQITEENLGLAADLIGKVVTDDRGIRCIAIDRKLVPSTKKSHAYVGEWITRSGLQVHVYSPKMFKNLYTQLISGSSFDFEDRNGWSGKLHM